MGYLCLAVLAVLATVPPFSLATSLSPWNDLKIKHAWHAIPKNWESLGSPPFNTTIDLYIGLKPHRENALTDTLYEVSTPGHPKYGKHLSKEQVADLVAPHPETLALVHSYLNHHGIPSSAVSMTLGGSALLLEGVSVTQANALLGTSYQLYRHVEWGGTIIRTMDYSLPVALHDHVRSVSPTTTFDSPQKEWQRTRNPSGKASKEKLGDPTRRDGPVLVDPPFLRWLYDLDEYVPTMMDKNSIAIAAYMKSYASRKDLKLFMAEYRTDLVSAGEDADFNVVKVNWGGYNENKPDFEASVDMQYAQGLAYPTPHTIYSTGRGFFGLGDYFKPWLRYVLELDSIPLTISTSFAIDETYCSQEYAIEVCDLFAQLGNRGVSVLFASGDDGVGAGNCVTKDGSIQFIPLFPPTCPYVTAVGGTTAFNTEQASQLSGGGFSNHFKVPPYQEKRVERFLEKLGSMHEGRYNAGSRAIPDVAAQANNFLYKLKGKDETISGTSAATPVFAAVVAMLNDYRLSKGRNPLGWLNPWLYGDGSEGFNDIDEGFNKGCGLDKGFDAVPGWDPVTGLGTPMFRDMQEVIDKEPPDEPDEPGEPGGDDGAR